MFENLLKEFRVEPAYGSNVGAVHRHIIRETTCCPRLCYQFFDSFELPLTLLYVNPGDSKNSEKSVQLV